MAKAKTFKTNSKPWFRVKQDMKSSSPTAKYYHGKAPKASSDSVFRGLDEYQEKSLSPELLALCRLRR